MSRRNTRLIMLGNISIGANTPISVQSMTNTDTRNGQETLDQIMSLAKIGCDIVRVAVPDEMAAKQLSFLVDKSPVPIIADIHFDYRLALKAIEAGCQGIRINPGNIGNADNIKKIANAAKTHDAVIRIGVNSGSLEKDIIAKYWRPCAEALAESAVSYAKLLEKFGFEKIKLSVKSSSVLETIAAYRAVSKISDYPLHLGVTEAGNVLNGSIKSAIALGALLQEGIGDTIRVSLTGSPENEVKAANEILRCLGLRDYGPEIISCPTCGRTEIDLTTLADQVEKMLADCRKNIKVAIMGCPVNGPGEAREADIGLAGGRDMGIIFRKGKIVRSVHGQANLLEAFSQELNILLKDCRQENN